MSALERVTSGWRGGLLQQGRRRGGQSGLGGWRVGDARVIDPLEHVAEGLADALQVAQGQIALVQLAAGQLGLHRLPDQALNRLR